MLKELQTELGSTRKGINEIKCKLNQKKVLLDKKHQILENLTEYGNITIRLRH